MADWSSLPSELVRTIGDKLEAIEDYSALSAVCKSFRFATGKDQWHPKKVSQPPWLLLCCHDDDGSGKNNNNPPTNQRFLLSMYKRKKIFCMNLPEIQGRRCFGTPYGWLVTLGHDGQLHLFNPLNRRRIALPEATCDREFKDENERKNWIRRRLRDRAILIKRPPNSYSSSGYDDFLVVSITCLGSVSVMRPRTNSWEELYLSGTLIDCMFDVISYQGQIYVVGVCGELIVCSNLDGPDPPTAEEYVAGDPDQIDNRAQLYLVESNGELLSIVRYRYYDADEDCHDDNDPEADPHYKTVGFEIFQLDQKTKKWIELELDEFGDRAFFVGDCQAMVLSSAEIANCKSSCVYFADDRYEQFAPHRGGLDMGTYDIKEGTIQPFYEGADTRSHYSVPTWFIPAFT